MRLSFTKMHGLGNDFIVFDAPSPDLCPSPATLRRLADRRTGIGFDQALVLSPPRQPGTDVYYRIFNADGSEVEQCGNGARCIAAWLVRAGVARGDGFALDSPVGLHAVTRLGGGRYRIDMGVPEFDPARIPLQGMDGESGEYVLQIHDTVLSFGAVSMGNPHAVIEVDDVDAAPLACIGPLLQSDAAFPQSVNVGFAQVLSRDRVRLRVYERGAGETLACGSGACAAAAVLMRRGRIDRDATISLPGGELRISWPVDAGPLSMAGPAAFVFEGNLTLGIDDMESGEQ